jgi:hypothetical protein
VQPNRKASTDATSSPVPRPSADPEATDVMLAKHRWREGRVTRAQAWRSSSAPWAKNSRLKACCLLRL